MVISADDRVLIKVLRQEKGEIHRRISQQTRFGGRCRSVCIAAGFMTLTSWSHAWSKSGNISTSCVYRWSDQAVASTSSSLHSCTRRAFWTHTLVMFDICTDVHFDSHMSVRLAIVDTFVLGDLTTPSITVASVDRFYFNFVICLQLDIALLIQNSVKIWHCLSELWQCIQGVTFFVDTVY